MSCDPVELWLFQSQFVLSLWLAAIDELQAVADTRLNNHVPSNNWLETMLGVSCPSHYARTVHHKLNLFAAHHTHRSHLGAADSRSSSSSQSQAELSGSRQQGAIYETQPDWCLISSQLNHGPGGAAVTREQEQERSVSHYISLQEISKQHVPSCSDEIPKFNCFSVVRTFHPDCGCPVVRTTISALWNHIVQQFETISKRSPAALQYISISSWFSILIWY